MKFFNSIVKLSLLSAFAVVTSTNASTTTWEWDLRAGQAGNTVTSCSNYCPTDSFSVTDTQGSESVKADLSAWADTQGDTGSGPNRDPYIDQAKMYYWDNNSWGAVNSDESSREEPGHAFDNMGNAGYVDYDMVLVSFDTSVALTGIDFGWRSDGDFTLLAYTGSGVFSGNQLDGSTWGAQASSGNWLTVGQYNGGPNSDNGYYAVNNTDVSSQFWLIGAYNSVFGTGLTNNNNITSNNDAFKIKRLRGDSTDTPPPEEVPAPTALGLLLVGALGIYARRNKKVA
ncbi:exosortase-dependent surface protein XDP1 [Paraglaciecola hydrolytica]|uniref:PEP-CTERM protein-sorting domain-containing protein n=1 Tax=Paraglaciecola hydrolytica TaxID=1799789 RepID=A0A136A2P6_9ALTE|nr:exosortase-dependent surface protein XDP1 [Paraglaciecola hydrolytica]KXI29518.1 hypothetical protein AX660_05520 [Paraglaciecola hydrolytica]